MLDKAMCCMGRNTNLIICLTFGTNKWAINEKQFNVINNYKR